MRAFPALIALALLFIAASVFAQDSPLVNCGSTPDSEMFGGFSAGNSGSADTAKIVLRVRGSRAAIDYSTDECFSSFSTADSISPSADHDSVVTFTITGLDPDHLLLPGCDQ